MGPKEQVWRHRFAPLGIPTIVIANDPELLATVRAAYAGWAVEAPETDPALIIRLDAGSAPSTGVSCGVTVEGSRLTLAGDQIAGQADAAAGEASATVPARLIGDSEALAAEVTDTLLLFLLARHGRVPLHAAGVIVQGRVLVLAGPSGSGKSSLALAALGRGLALLSDDTLYVQRDPVLRLWGLPRPIHVFPRDAPSGRHATRLRGGKLKAVVPLPQAKTPRFADEAAVIVLERSDELSLVPIDAETAVRGLARLDPGFDLLPEESAAVARILAKDGAWRLSTGGDPGAAIELLCHQFGTDPL